jgi:hypothetical protein
MGRGHAVAVRRTGIPAGIRYTLHSAGPLMSRPSEVYPAPYSVYFQVRMPAHNGNPVFFKPSPGFISKDLKRIQRGEIYCGKSVQEWCKTLAESSGKAVRNWWKSSEKGVEKE